ncbi:MAG TPA: hypothetical protein VGR41_08340 [Actinomycetota bacterium]|jgi:hypothetical protein|nr:hypothetical protein [Actinomycetota bacterium]
MSRTLLAALGTIALLGTLVAVGSLGRASAGDQGASEYEPVLDPAKFTTVIDNPYFPLPVGRTLVYRGVRDGQSQADRVSVTSHTKVAEGITARVVRDVAKHKSTLLEKTFDLYAQDNEGNVWYLGEDTKAYNPDGSIDTSGSWQAGVHDAEPGIIMEANPQVPDAYRQEYLKGEAEDTAWIVDRGGSVTVQYGTVHDILTSLEFARIEPNVVDRKIYAPGFGIVSEKALAGDQEVATLVSVKTSTMR